MTDKSTPKAAAAAAPEGERIAKVLSRRGVASRREAERLIEAGEVAVNGKVIVSPALNVTPKDRITVSGKPLPEEEPARLWLYYKPEGLVTSAADEKGRDTVFDHLPEDMPRVMSVGRLDLNSEGLLLLTNDGELKRRLELPSTGWLRKYRVRVNGNPVDPDLDPLRKGIVVDGERFQPMQVVLDRVQGANAWLTVGLREGKNREIRRAMNAIGLYVNRLIRTSYGPFRLGELQPGEVEEVRQKVLRDQLGENAVRDEAKPPRPAAGKPGSRTGAKPAARPARSTSTERPAKAAPKTAAPAKPARPAAPSAKRSARPERPGDGIRILSAAWKEAVRPRLPGEEDAAPAPRKPARGGATPSAKAETRPAAKPGAKAPPKPKPAAKPAAKPAPGRKPPRTTGPGQSPGGGTKRK